MIELDFSRCRTVPVPQDDGSVVLMPPPKHVKEAVAALVRMPYVLLGDEMGGMKSSQAIIAAQFLYEAGEIDRVIVLAPAAVAPNVWYSQELGEIAQQVWVPSSVAQLHSRVRAWKNNDDIRRLSWVVTNYEWIRGGNKVESLFPSCGMRTLLICDESSAFRNHKSDTYRAVWELRKRCGRIWEMNGTPIAQSPEDMFAQMNMMDHRILDCKYVTQFRARYAVLETVRGAGGRALLNKWNRPIERVAKWTNLEDLERRCAPYIIRRDWRKWMDLPEALPPVTLTVTLSAAEWRVYKEMRDEMVAWLQSGDVAVTMTAATRVLRLAQITSGFVGGVERGDEEAGDEDPNSDRPDRLGSIFNGVVPDPARRVVTPVRPLQEIGRTKLDFLLEWQQHALVEDPNLKLLVWCKFVPELRRYLQTMSSWIGKPFVGDPQSDQPTGVLFYGSGPKDMEIGAVCGVPILEKRKKDEREKAERLLHPRTAPPGPVTVGGTLGTGALGLNFTACHTVVNLSHDYAPWKRAQADKRVDRPGQRRPVATFDIVAQGPKGQRTIDSDIVAARRSREDVNNRSMAAWVRALGDE